MHRVKRPSPETRKFGLSQAHYRTTHELPGGESKTKTVKQYKNIASFQLNATGGLLTEEFEEQD